MKDKELFQIELGHIQKDVDELKKNQKEMIKELAKYKGVVGGVMLAISALTACGTLIYKYFQGS